MLRTSSAINKKYASREFLFLVSNIFVLLNIPPWLKFCVRLFSQIYSSKNSITFFLLIYLFFDIFFVVVVVFSFFFFLPFPFSLPLAHHIRHILWALCVLFFFVKKINKIFLPKKKFFKITFCIIFLLYYQYSRICMNKQKSNIKIIFSYCKRSQLTRTLTTKLKKKSCFTSLRPSQFVWV